MSWLNLLTVSLALSCAAFAAADNDSLASCLASKSVPAITPQHPTYAALIDPFNRRLRYYPKSLAEPKTVEQVASAISCARQHGYKVAARSGGHSYGSFGLGGKNGSLVIDTRKFKAIEVDPITQIASIGPGARLGNIALELYAQGQRALPHGLCPGVGLGGHATNGGFGFTSRMWGITLDTIVSMQVVLADGSITEVSKTVNADLFWALRGAGPSFGIVTQFRFQTLPAPQNTVYFIYNFTEIMNQPAKQAAVFTDMQTFSATAAPANMAMRALLGFGNYAVMGAFFGSRSDFDDTMAPLLASDAWRDTPPAPNIVELGWLDALVAFNFGGTLEVPDVYEQHDTFFVKSVISPDPLTPASLLSFFSFNRPLPPQPFMYYAIFDLYGGVHSRLTNAFTAEDAAYAGRDALWTVQLYSTTLGQAEYPAEGIQFMDAFQKSITGPMPDTVFMAYPNYIDPSLSARQAHQLYYGRQYPRLAKLKKRYDPGMVFWNPQGVGVQ